MKSKDGRPLSIDGKPMTGGRDQPWEDRPEDVSCPAADTTAAAAPGVVIQEGLHPHPTGFDATGWDLRIGIEVMGLDG